ncbi:MAG: FHA domain-containing protein, partial [Planctomycetes bacterium]|nr:FHA domain-containing protein [Planctomycetota bacterium]
MSPAHQVETLEFSLTAADGRVFCLELHEGRSVLAGRDLGAEVVIPDGRVSRHHASLSLEDSGLWIEDLHSQNGTLVNDEKAQRALLQDGDAISLGGYQMRMTVTSLEKSSPGELARRGSAAREVVSADCADLDGDTVGETNLELYLGRLADRLEA